MNRRRVVTGVRIVGVVAVCGLALLLAVRLQARSADVKLENEFRQKVGPLDPAAYASPAVPDAENAAIWLRAAAAALTLSKEDKDLVAALGHPAADRWTAVQQTAIERVFSRNAPALALAERASAMPRSNFQQSGSGATNSKDPVPLFDLIWLARVIDERARVAARQGDWAVFRQGTFELACVGASLERESPLMSQLVGVAVERMMFDAILGGLRSTLVDRAALEGLGAAIPNVALVPAWRRAVGALAAGVHAGLIDPHDLFDKGSTEVAMSVPSPEEYLRIALSVEGLAARPLGLDPPLADHLEKAKGLEKGRTISDLLALSLVRYQSIVSLRQLARVAISLRLAALENGRYPDTLAAWPEASAPDPFTGGRLRYELTADGSAVVAVPGAEELYDRINQVKSFVPYTWALPAPASGTPTTTE